MARFIYAPDCPGANENGVVPAEVYYPWKYGHAPSSAAPHIIRDGMEPTKHMADGKVYDSKRAFRDATRAAGCVEVGNEVNTLLTPRKPVALNPQRRRQDIKRAIWELNNGRRVR